MKKEWILLGCIGLLVGCSGEENESLTPKAGSEQKDSVAVEGSLKSEERMTTAQYEVDPVTYLLKPIEGTGADSEVVLLTIDDAPEKYSTQMAHTLKEVDAPAIFFVNGHFLEDDSGKEKLREIHELGFAIGNHTMTHTNLSTLSEAEQKEEIIGLNDLVASIIGERPRFFRAPFGVNTDYVRELAKEEGMALMNWTYGYDWEPDYQTAAALADAMVNSQYLQPGANLLMHDRKWTADGLADIVIGLREQGYGFVDPLQIQTVEDSNQGVD